jgi:hypothetical protein
MLKYPDILLFIFLLTGSGKAQYTFEEAFPTQKLN